MREAYDDEGRRYVEAPLIEPRGPVQTTDMNGNLPFMSGFNQGAWQGRAMGSRSEVGGFFSGYLLKILLIVSVVLFGIPVLIWSKYLWIVILGRRDERPGSIARLLLGLVSVIVWLPFYGFLLTICISLPATIVPPIGIAIAGCPPANAIYESSSALFGLIGPAWNATTNHVAQTTAALAAHVTYAEGYSGPLFYQALGFVSLMVLAVVSFRYGAQRPDRGTGREFRFWMGALAPAFLGFLFCLAGWMVLGAYLLFTGLLFICHCLLRPD